MNTETNVVPHRIAVDNAKLKLSWNDKEATLDGPSLRAACRCAQCRRERLNAGDSIDVPLSLSATEADVAVVSAMSIGYGLQLHFSDGHSRGIFPWAYLHELASLVSSTHESSGQTST